ncbi:hypothetical protein AGLY_006328 [Aphis glycines]|uniref:Uncharacterized protein n=1 Tax=Aphis glycines TaxID=307491 RepID=A0A6G0TT21_APHGL|nr:hypothetical protein AGLY_006328 [Aphis glycines]
MENPVPSNLLRNYQFMYLLIITDRNQYHSELFVRVLKLSGTENRISTKSSMGVNNIVRVLKDIRSITIYKKKKKTNFISINSCISVKHYKKNVKKTNLPIIFYRTSSINSIQNIKLSIYSLKIRHTQFDTIETKQIYNLYVYMVRYKYHDVSIKTGYILKLCTLHIILSKKLDFWSIYINVLQFV